MYDLKGSQAGAMLERRFASIGSEVERNRIRSLLIGATEVKFTMVMRRPGTAGSEQTQVISVQRNVGVKDDARACGIVPVNGLREPVLSKVYGKVGDATANLAQVTLVDLGESARLASLLGVDYMPLGFQSENIVLDAVFSGSHQMMGLSDLWPGAVITFISPSGELRQATLHVVGRAQPYDFAQDLLCEHFGRERLLTDYAEAAVGTCGIAAIAKTPGLVHQNDIALIWQHA